MFNLDVYGYPVGSTMGLYGAIPYLISHRPESSVGVFWLNASETWVDVSRSNTGVLSRVKGEKENTEVHWMSESGVVEVHLLLGPSPKDVFRQYTTLTGTTSLPPLFALGYHQCRWNYDNEEDVEQVDQGFDTHEIPYDVLWLDIEHTDAKKYFTWDPVQFPTPLEMQQKLAVKKRKVPFFFLSFFLCCFCIGLVLTLGLFLSPDGHHHRPTHQERDWLRYSRRSRGEQLPGSQ